jgi:2,4-dienoyl-CoA reductase-like NADH-dependent reductase (Old Yellow Enzyme family)
MSRHDYKIFSQGQIGLLKLKNRLVRSATWDPSILDGRGMNDDVLNIYRRVAAGGVGLIITGDFSVLPPNFLDVDFDIKPFSYETVRIKGFGQLVDTVRRASPDCKIIAQLSGDYYGIGPSAIPSPFTTEQDQPLSVEQIRSLVECFVQVIYGIQREGFDGVQLHAAHGGLLSKFLSPYTNRRGDQYGGSIQNRVRILSEIVTSARKKVGDFPILVKVNATDYLDGGTNLDTFPGLASEIERAGVDAIEVSGGMWDCLVKSEAELGFRPIPTPESHTRIKNPEKQSYFLKYAEQLDSDIPVILVGGNRDAERLEKIIQAGKVDFISLCRPLICEPDLPKRWLEGRGTSGTECFSCNSCIYDMYTKFMEGAPRAVHCVYKQNRQEVKTAQRWLSTWVADNTLIRE